VSVICHLDTKKVIKFKIQLYKSDAVNSGVAKEIAAEFAKSGGWVIADD